MGGGRFGVILPLATLACGSFVAPLRLVWQPLAAVSRLNFLSPQVRVFAFPEISIFLGPQVFGGFHLVFTESALVSDLPMMFTYRAVPF